MSTRGGKVKENKKLQEGQNEVTINFGVQAKGTLLYIRAKNTKRNNQIKYDRGKCDCPILACQGENSEYGKWEGRLYEQNGVAGKLNHPYKKYITVKMNIQDDETQLLLKYSRKTWTRNAIQKHDEVLVDKKSL